MARIRIDLPDDFLFETEIAVRITDLNYGGHVGNDSILTLMHEARVRFLENYDCNETNFFGAGLIMSDVGIEYINELFYKDQLSVKIGIGDFKRVSFDLYYLFEIRQNGEYK